LRAWDGGRLAADAVGSLLAQVIAERATVNAAEEQTILRVQAALAEQGRGTTLARVLQTRIGVRWKEERNAQPCSVTSTSSSTPTKPAPVGTPSSRVKTLPASTARSVVVP